MSTAPSLSCLFWHECKFHSLIPAALFLPLPLGMESLGCALNYFEDALAAYSAGGLPGAAAPLTTQEEAEFVHSLQAVIEGAYSLQDQCEHLFLHQVILAEPVWVPLPVPGNSGRTSVSTSLCTR